MKIKKTILFIFLIISGALTIFPFLWMLAASFMLDGKALVYPPLFIPSPFVFDQYILLFEKMNFFRSFMNSLFLSVTVTMISLLFNSMAAYAFAKYNFRGRDKLFGLLLSSMLIPAQITMLPLFIMLKSVGVINTYFAIIIPGMANVFGIFLIRQYIFSIPDSLIEAARIDGASEFTIYSKIIIPLIRPILVTLALFTFLGTWNDFLWPLIALADDSMYTLPVVLANLMGEHTQDPELMMAGAVLTIMPVIFVFLLLQKYYIEEIMKGSVKG